MPRVRVMRHTQVNAGQAVQTSAGLYHPACFICKSCCCMLCCAMLSVLCFVLCCACAVLCCACAVLCLCCAVLCCAVLVCCPAVVFASLCALSVLCVRCAVAPCCLCRVGNNCGETISSGTPYVEYGDSFLAPYHPKCFHAWNQDRCAKCKQAITSEAQQNTQQQHRSGCYSPCSCSSRC